MVIINNNLPWNGDHLGSYVNNFITFTYKNRLYHEIRLEAGNIYTIAKLNKGLLPCIIDELKPLFNLPRRGLHLINLDGKEYIIYYVPYIDNNLVYETGLSEISIDAPIRIDNSFQRMMRQNIIFCDILSLTRSNESNIWIRDNKPLLVAVDTTALKHDRNIISNSFMYKWYNETLSFEEIFLTMIEHYFDADIEDVEVRNLDLINNLSKQIKEIVIKYDKNYIWYVSFITSRLTKRLNNSTE